MSSEAKTEDGSKALNKNLEVVAYSKEHTVSLADYKRCVAMHAFEGQAMSMRALANPRFQRDEARRCYQIQYLRHYAQEQGLVVSQEARQEAIQNVLKRDHLPNQAALAERLAIDDGDLMILVNDEILPKIIQKHLASQINEAAAKERYQRDFRRFDLEIACFENTPNDAEIQNAVATESDAIEGYFALAPWRFAEPPKAHFTRYAFANTGTEIEQALARQNAQHLRQVAMQEGEDKATQHCIKLANAGCRVLNDGNKPYVLERCDENAWAFKVAVGFVPEIIVSEGQEEVWLLTDISAPGPADIKDPQVCMRVAQKMLCENKPLERLSKGLKNLFQTQGEDLKLAADTLQGDYKSFPEIYAIDLERVPKALPPAMLEALATLKDEDINLISDPILAGGRIYIFRVKSLDSPKDSSYTKDKSAWLERVGSDPRLGLVQNLIENSMPPISALDIRGVQIHYGVLQPNGRIN